MVNSVDGGFGQNITTRRCEVRDFYGASSSKQPIDFTSKDTKSTTQIKGTQVEHEASSAANAAEDGYSVKKGDNLWNIAKKHLQEINGGKKPKNAEIAHHMQEIMTANGLKFAKDGITVLIKAGDVLKMPGAKEAAAMAEANNTGGVEQTSAATSTEAAAPAQTPTATEQKAPAQSAQPKVHGSPAYTIPESDFLEMVENGQLHKGDMIFSHTTSGGTHEAMVIMTSDSEWREVKMDSPEAKQAAAMAQANNTGRVEQTLAATSTEAAAPAQTSAATEQKAPAQSAQPKVYGSPADTIPESDFLEMVENGQLKAGDVIYSHTTSGGTSSAKIIMTSDKEWRQERIV